ncbi:hypothetical protein GJ496_000531 [Pomphorhynchus laevis]|nr:hypothetical protein GJ496_000531 [Pomphorhynchus laevis]
MGFLRPPITFHIVDEVSAMVSTNSNRFVPLLGDDQFKAIPKRAMLIEYTPYTCLLLNVLCQHTNVDELPIFRWRSTDASLNVDNDASPGTILPAPQYNANLRCIVPGT